MRGGIVFLIGIGIAGVFLLTFWSEYRLEVTSQEGQKIPLSFRISSGDRFSIWFLHSYDRAFFQENYEIDRKYQIILKNMVFKSHLNGAGFSYPHFRLRPDGMGELMNINEFKRRIEFMMGSADLANHTLILKGITIELSRFFQFGEIIQIQITKKVRLIEALKNLLKKWRTQRIDSPKEETLENL